MLSSTSTSKPDVTSCQTQPEAGDKNFKATVASPVGTCGSEKKFLAVPQFGSRDASFKSSVYEKIEAPPAGWARSDAQKLDKDVATIKLRIHLVQQDMDKFHDLAMKIATPGHELYGNHLSQHVIDAMIAPKQQSKDLVIQWLESAGLKEHASFSPRSDSVIVETSVKNIEKLLNTEYQSYANSRSGETVLRTLSYSLPNVLKGHVDSVQPTTFFGLRTMGSMIKDFQPHIEETLSTEGTSAVKGCSGSSITPTCLANLYNFASITPSNQTLGRMGIGGFLQQHPVPADLTTFMNKYAFFSNKDQTYSCALINNGTCPSTDTQSNIIEANLDAAPPPWLGSGTNTNEPYLEFLNYLLALPDAQLPNTVSISYGDDEVTVPLDYATSTCNLFSQLGARGVSVLVASGDSGVGSTCTMNGKAQFTTSFPAGCPWVTTVGGTTGTSPEGAWSDGGGGFSEVFGRPSYQDAVVSSWLTNDKTHSGVAQYFNSSGRAYPDISGQSVNFLVMILGSASGVSGTSASTPTVASVIQLLNNLFTTAVSTAGSSAANKAQDEFGISKAMSIFLFISVYLLGQGLGGIIFSPFSETFGRKILYIISTALYGVFCMVIAVVPSLAGVVIGRFSTGFLSAIPTTVVVGSIEDMFNSKGRVWLVFLWAMVSNIGLVLGPIMSTYITAALGWRWVFYVAAVVTGVLTVLLFLIRESRPSLLLVREVASLRKKMGDDNLQALNPDHAPDLHTFSRLALTRPLHLFFTEPIVFMVALMSAAAFALIYLFTEALPPIYESLGFTLKTASLQFLAIAIGLTAGILTRLLDMRTLARHHRQGLPLTPEDKLIGFSIGAPVLAGALWCFAWTVPPRVHGVHWLVSTVPLAFVGYALNEFDCVLAGYLADSYLSYAASGFAAVALLRSTMSASFPLFAVKMFEALGANVAISILAALATVFCLVPRLFTKYGKRIRARMSTPTSASTPSEKFDELHTIFREYLTTPAVSEDHPNDEEPIASKVRDISSPCVTFWPTDALNLELDTFKEEALKGRVIGDLSSRNYVDVFWEVVKHQEEIDDEKIVVYEAETFSDPKFILSFKDQPFELTYTQCTSLVRENEDFSQISDSFLENPENEIPRNLRDFVRSVKIGSELRRFLDSFPAIRTAYFYIKRWAAIRGLTPSLPDSRIFKIVKEYHTSLPGKSSSALVERFFQNEALKIDTFADLEIKAKYHGFDGASTEAFLAWLNQLPFSQKLNYPHTIRVAVMYSGFSQLKGAQWLLMLEQRLSKLKERLEASSVAFAHIWPQRLILSDSTANDAVYEGNFIVGLRPRLGSKSINTGRVQEIADNWMSQALRNKSTVAADCFMWVTIDDLPEFKICTKTWPRLVLQGDEIDSGERGEVAELLSQQAKQSRASAPHEGEKLKRLRPASDILSRLKYDTSYNIDEFVIGYEDRVKIKVVEKSAADWELDTTAEEWIPEHRVQYFKRYGSEDGEDGQIMWQKSTRLDKIFE
ncbi:hypothetical protein G7Y89_g10196 [Cudoniella acicularis]|uniref:Major facilitator superfamily (MFS) profile domain-containing protein n=1 Tax=Cudoniella acicularis TaxID=354080 RepID=A0A8H4RFZ6_9HELO|nr:hypothetical protein G7Y89_g10196 [Cudoniella acicularis]